MCIRDSAGTENVPGIVGLGKATERAMATMKERTDKEIELRDYLIDRVLKEIPYTRLNGHRTTRLPNNANFSFQFIEGESLLIMLDMEGICGSSGSACTSGSLDPSHVLIDVYKRQVPAAAQLFEQLSRVGADCPETQKTQNSMDANSPMTSPTTAVSGDKTAPCSQATR